jgi:hypothetical protein
MSHFYYCIGRRYILGYKQLPSVVERLLHIFLAFVYLHLLFEKFMSQRREIASVLMDILSIGFWLLLLLLLLSRGRHVGFDRLSMMTMTTMGHHLPLILSVCIFWDPMGIA